MRKTLLAAALAAFGLSACSSLSDKTPQEMMQISMARSLKQDHSYNFSGEARVYLSKQQDGVAPPDAAAEVTTDENNTNAAGAATGTAYDALADNLDEATSERALALMMEEAYLGKDGKGIGDMMVKGLQEYPVLASYIGNGRLKLDGAVDMREQLLEVVPELELNGRNEQIAVKMPILMNGKDMSITAELPDSLPVVLNFLVDKPMRNRLLSEPVRLSLSDGDKQGMPVRNAMKAAVYAVYKAYGELPPGTFKLKEMDSFGKQIGSRYRLEMALDGKTNRAYYEAALREFSAKLDELEQTSPEAGATEAGYDRVHSIAGSIVRMSTMLDVEKVYGSPVLSSFYLDRKGRLVGMRQYVQFNGSNGQALNVDSNLKLYNFGKPVFTFQPKNAKTISLNELRDAINTQKKERDRTRYGRDEGGYADDLSDIEAPTEPYVIEEQVLAK